MVAKTVFDYCVSISDANNISTEDIMKDLHFR